jgi:hypothetical protein
MHILAASALHSHSSNKWVHKRAVFTTTSLNHAIVHENKNKKMIEGNVRNRRDEARLLQQVIFTAWAWHWLVTSTTAHGITTDEFKELHLATQEFCAVVESTPQAAACFSCGTAAEIACARAA